MTNNSKVKINFTKMHGLGNDFIIIDDREERLAGLPGLSKRLCNRRFGIGADQLIIIRDSDMADFRMLIYNPDGSEAEMCGNGVRCFARYLLTGGITSNEDLNIETKGGIIKTKVRGGLVEVDMGEPRLEPEDIPVRLDGRVISHPLRVLDEDISITCVSMGNPHTVIFLKEVRAFPVDRFGPVIENHNLFPQRTNVEFARVVSEREIEMRVWERGAGETMACGTGACATLVAAVLNGLTHKRATVHLKGGDLDILWGEDNHIYMTGPAEEVFVGEMEI